MFELVHVVTSMDDFAMIIHHSVGGGGQDFGHIIALIKQSHFISFQKCINSLFKGSHRFLKG
jgi:hypothetical protein